MIPHGVEVFVGLDPIDLRWGFERLSGVIAEKLGRSSRSGAMFVFFGKRRTALKILFVPDPWASGRRRGDAHDWRARA
ncbi:MAG: transposase [Deltaproteobacteria bacterium]|nr:MAG: transposase [Deltaproteobacteria bacterium]